MFIFFSSLANTKGTVLPSGLLLVKANMKWSLAVRNWHIGVAIFQTKVKSCLILWLHGAASHIQLQMWRLKTELCPKIYPTPHQAIQSQCLAGCTMNKMVILAHCWSSATWIMAFQGWVLPYGQTVPPDITHTPAELCGCIALFLSWLIRWMFFLKHSTFCLFLCPYRDQTREFAA